MMARTGARFPLGEGQAIDTLSLVPTLRNKKTEFFVIASRLEHENMIGGDGLDGFLVSRSRKHGYSIAEDPTKSKGKPQERGCRKCLLHKGLRWLRPAATAVSPYLTSTYGIRLNHPSSRRCEPSEADRRHPCGSRLGPRGHGSRQSSQTRPSER